MVEVSDDQGINAVQRHIEKRWNIPAGLQRCVCEGREIRTDRSLKEYGVTADATIQILLRIRGGMISTLRGDTGYTDREMRAAFCFGTTDTECLEPEAGHTRIVAMNIDGVPDNTGLAELTQTLTEIHTDITLMGDTQRPDQQRAVRLQCAMRTASQATAELDDTPTPVIKWKHGYKEIGPAVGGVSMSLPQHLHNRAAARKKGSSPEITDKTGMGRYRGVILLGKKSYGRQHTIGIITVYAPCPGGKWAEWIQKQNKDTNCKTTDANLRLIDDLEEAMLPHVHEDHTWILCGDLNCRIGQTETNSTREKHRTRWEQFIDAHDLEQTGSEGPTCFPSNGQPSRIDHILTSGKLGEYISRVHTIDAYAKAPPKERLANSIHAMMLIDVDIRRWLGTSGIAHPTTKTRPRTLMYRNLKQRTEFHDALQKMEDEAETNGTRSADDMEHMVLQMETEGGHDLPEWANDEMEAAHRRMIAAEDDIRKEGVETKRNKAANFKQTWTPQMIVRMCNIELLARALRDHKTWGNQPTVMKNRIKETIAAAAKKVSTCKGCPLIPGITVPETRNEHLWSEWRDKVKNEIKKYMKHMHNKRLKNERKKISKYVRAIEKLREDNEVGKYVARVLGCQRGGQPLTLTVPDEEPGSSKIIEDPEEFKETMRDYTVLELGKGRKRWFMNDTATHPIAQMTPEGDKVRKTLAHGTDSERQEVKNTIPPCFWEAADAMKAKEGAKEKWYEHVMKTITKDEWDKRVSTKKKNTAPGKSQIRVDHVAAAPDSTQRKIRALCNMSILSGVPCDMWLDELIWKIPKDPGPAKIDRMRPLKFLEITRKMTQGIIKTRLQDVWFKKRLISPDQFGSMPDVSTFHPALIKRFVAEDATFHKKSMYALDEDLTKGFDRVERFIKDAALRRYGVPDNVRNYLLAFDEGNRNSVITPYGLTEEFHAEAASLAQGCEASPILWVAVMDMMLEFTRKHNTNPYMYTTDENGTQIPIAQILYVDDGSYITRTERALRRVAQATQTFASFSGLEINTKKSWAVALTHDDRGRPSLDIPSVDIRLEEWVSAPPDSQHKSTPPDLNYHEWAVTRSPKAPIKWKAVTEHYRHLGNVQDTLGDNSKALRNAKGVADKLAKYLSNKKISAAGARLLQTLVLTAKVKYSMTLSNTTTEQIDQLQATTKKNAPPQAPSPGNDGYSGHLRRVRIARLDEMGRHLPNRPIEDLPPVR